MIVVVKEQFGVLYCWGGMILVGFDCSGFIYYVLNKVIFVFRLMVVGYWNIMKLVSQLVVGDFVFFIIYKVGFFYVGIYFGNGEFINVNDFGVVIFSMNNFYWKQCYFGVK